jgi:hypothetical protein
VRACVRARSCAHCACSRDHVRGKGEEERSAMKSNIANTVLGGQKKMPSTKSAIKPNMMPNLEECC